MLLTLVLGLYMNPIFSQKVSKILSEFKVGTMKCQNKMEIDLTQNDTTFYVTNYFQNMKYSTIIDLGSLFFMHRKNLEKTIEDIEMCLPYMDEKSDEFSVGKFRISSSSKTLYIFDDGKYTGMSKKQVIKWLEWLKGTTLK